MFNSILRTSEAVTSTQAVALREVRKVYGRGDGSVVALDGVTVGLALDGVTVVLARGSFTALMGPSGSGRSTFLNVAAGRFRSANCQRRPRARMPVPTSNQGAESKRWLVPLLARSRTSSGRLISGSPSNGSW
jgi:ABC-type glutathione transport system ATPase component